MLKKLQLYGRVPGERPKGEEQLGNEVSWVLLASGGLLIACPDCSGRYTLRITSGNSVPNKVPAHLSGGTLCPGSKKVTAKRPSLAECPQCLRQVKPVEYPSIYSKSALIYTEHFDTEGGYCNGSNKWVPEPIPNAVPSVPLNYFSKVNESWFG